MLIRSLHLLKARLMSLNAPKLAMISAPNHDLVLLRYACRVSLFSLAVFADECADIHQQDTSSAGYTSQRFTNRRSEVTPIHFGQHHLVRAHCDVHLYRLLMYYAIRTLHLPDLSLSILQRSANSAQERETGIFWCV